eukprot:14393659-Alexandrium_andersonii.AAC.1
MVRQRRQRRTHARPARHARSTGLRVGGAGAVSKVGSASGAQRAPEDRTIPRRLRASPPVQWVASP